MIDAAKKWVGYLEHQTNELLGFFTANAGKGGCTIFALIVVSHYKWLNFSGLPWCATFVHGVFLDAYGAMTARELVGRPHPGTRVLARHFRRKGRLMSPEYMPSEGDIIFLHNGDGKIGHCGIVEKVEDGVVISIEGNTTDPTGYFKPHQGGAVAVRKRKLTDPAILYYGQILLKEKCNE